MIKHTKKIRRQQPTNCLSVFDLFVGLALKGFNVLFKIVFFTAKFDLCSVFGHFSCSVSFLESLLVLLF